MRSLSNDNNCFVSFSPLATPRVRISSPQVPTEMKSRVIIKCEIIDGYPQFSLTWAPKGNLTTMTKLPGATEDVVEGLGDVGVNYTCRGITEVGSDMKSHIVTGR